MCPVGFFKGPVTIVLGSVVLLGVAASAQDVYGMTGLVDDVANLWHSESFRLKNQGPVFAPDQRFRRL